MGGRSNGTAKSTEDSCGAWRHFPRPRHRGAFRFSSPVRHPGIVAHSCDACVSVPLLVRVSMGLARPGRLDGFLVGRILEPAAHRLCTISAARGCGPLRLRIRSIRCRAHGGYPVLAVLDSRALFSVCWRALQSDLTIRWSERLAALVPHLLWNSTLNTQPRAVPPAVAHLCLVR
jgi:hypothetical protein